MQITCYVCRYDVWPLVLRQFYSKEVLNSFAGSNTTVLFVPLGYSSGFWSDRKTIIDGDGELVNVTVDGVQIWDRQERSAAAAAAAAAAYQVGAGVYGYYTYDNPPGRTEVGSLAQRQYNWSFVGDVGKSTR